MLLTHHNIVYNDTPPLSSRAALILLKSSLSEQERAEWIEFRNEFLDTRPPICEYCGKTDLVKELIPGIGKAFLATIDHFVPVSHGGAVYDPDNLRVACYTCNASKGSLTAEEWLSRQIFHHL